MSFTLQGESDNAGTKCVARSIMEYHIRNSAGEINKPISDLQAHAMVMDFFNAGKTFKSLQHFPLKAEWPRIYP